MNIDFLATVEKSSGMPFGASELGSTAPGFREQINRAIRDYDERKNESGVEKKSADQKKPSASETKRNADSAKTDASKKTDRSDRADRADRIDSPDRSGKEREYDETAAQAAGDVEETSVTPGLEFPREFAASGNDSGFYGEFEDDETSETENAYALEAQPDASETPSAVADFSASDSAETQSFQSAPANDDSGFAAMMNMRAIIENAAAAAADAGFDASQRENAAAPQEAAVVNIPQNVSFSDNGAKELFEALADTVELADEESAPPEVKEILQDGLFRKNLAADQDSESARNAAASSRDGEARGDAAKTAANTDELPTEQSASRAASAASDVSEDEEKARLERLFTQTFRSREGSAFANASDSESTGKTVQFVDASVQVASGAAKTEAAAAAPRPSAPDLIIELAGRIQAQIRGGREIIRVQLQPENLGRLEIRAEAGRDGIIARIAAESLEVKKLLENNLQNLQHTLESRGLKVDRLHIVVEDNAYAAFTNDGRYGQAGANNSESPQFSKINVAGNESRNENEEASPEALLAAAAAQRGVNFYTIG